MTAALGNWISQNCSTIGFGDLVLTTSTLPKYLPFSQVLPQGLVYYSIIDGDDHEAGIGTFDGTNTIVRTTVHATKVGSVFSTNGVPLVLSGGSIVSCTLNATPFNEALHDKMDWGNKWAQGTYGENDVIRDGDWTMVANKETSDRPAPQSLGAPENSVDPSATFTTASDSSIIKMVHNFTLKKSGWFEQLRVRVPFWDLDSVTRVTVLNVTENIFKVVNNPILTSDAWVVVLSESTIALTGSQYEIWLEYYNSSDAGNIDGSWSSFIGVGVPASQDFTINNVTVPTVIEISHTDIDSGNRQVELDGVVVNSIISIVETGDVTRSIDLSVTAIDTVSTTSTKYSVSVIQSGKKDIRNNRICTISIDVPITQPSQYSKITNYYPTNDPSYADITTKLYFDGVLQAGATDAFGIDLIFQDATVSDDWDLLALSGGSGSGSITVVDNTKGQGDTASALSANQGYLLDQDIGIRETAATGLVSGGIVTQNTATTIDITLGEGEIVNGYTDRRNPTRINNSWPNTVGFTVTMTGAVGVQVIYVNSSGTILQKVDSLTSEEKRLNVRLALVYFKDGAIISIVQAGIYSNEVGNVLYDWLSFSDIVSRIKGLGINPVTSNIQVWADSGNLLSAGINAANSLTDPNIRSFPAVGNAGSPVSFDVIFADGANYLTAQTDIPKFFESAAGVATALSGNKAVIHYFFRTLGNTFILQLGSTAYSNGVGARDATEVDRASFEVFTNGDKTLLSAQIYADRTSSDFTDNTKAGIVSLIGAASSTAGSPSVIRSDVAIKYLSISDLRKRGNKSELTVSVDAHTTVGDKGEGELKWYPSSTATDDGGVTIEIDSETVGRYIRDITDTFSVAAYGVLTDGTDNTVAFTAAAAAAPGAIYIPPGTYSVLTGDYSDTEFYSDGIVTITTNTTIKYSQISGDNYFRLHDQKANGVNGGTATAGIVERDIIFESGNSELVTLSTATRFILKSGTWDVNGSFPGYATARHKAQLYNYTTAALILPGTSEFSSNVAATESMTRSVVAGRFVIAANQTIGFRHYISITAATIGLGIATSSGDPEVYSTASFTRVYTQ